MSFVDNNIRVLFIVQISNIKARKFIVDTDSNWNMYMRGIIPQLVVNYKWHFYVTVPSPKYVKNWTKHNSLDDYYSLIHPTLQKPEYKQYISFIEMPDEMNSVSQRYMFHIQAWKQFFRTYSDIDVIWCNFPELLRNVKWVLHALRNQGPLSITSFYWIDNPITPRCEEFVSFGFRQMDGAMTADIPQFAAKATLNHFAKGMNHYYKDEHVKSVYDKSKIFDFGASYSEIWSDENGNQIEEWTDFGGMDEIKDDDFVLLFPNRARGYTNWKRFIWIINELAEMRDDFVAVMTFPDGYSEYEKVKKDCPKIVNIDRKNRYEYIRLLHRADFVFSLFESEFYGGCATREGICAGALPVVYDAIAWHDMFPEGYELFIPKNTKQAAAKVSAIMNDHKKRAELKILMNDVIPVFSYEHVYKDVYESIKDFIENSVIDVRQGAMEKWTRYIYEGIQSIRNKTLFDEIIEDGKNDLIRKGIEMKLPISKGALIEIMYWRSKSQLMKHTTNKGEEKFNYWPAMKTKDWFVKLRWVLLSMGVIDETRKADSTYDLDLKITVSSLEAKTDYVITPATVDVEQSPEVFGINLSVPSNNDPWGDNEGEMLTKPILDDRDKIEFKDHHVMTDKDAKEFLNSDEYGNPKEYTHKAVCMTCNKEKSNISTGTGSCFECDEKEEDKKVDKFVDSVIKDPAKNAILEKLEDNPNVIANPDKDDKDAKKKIRQDKEKPEEDSFWGV